MYRIILVAIGLKSGLAYVKPVASLGFYTTARHHPLFHLFTVSYLLLVLDVIPGLS